LSNLSNKNLVRLTTLAEKVLVRDDPLVQKATQEVRRYFQEGHPCVELARRIFKSLSPNCKKKLIDCFFLNSIFEGVTKSQEFKDREGFEPPWFLVLSPTMRCNLNCLGCSTRKYTKSDDLPIELIERILDEAREMGIHFITTQGGEMFVYEEMLDVYRRNPDIYFQVYTNGTLIDRKMAKILSELGNVAPMVSLEGFQEETDSRRGEGVFRKVMECFDNLRREGVFYGASITQTRKNTETILSDKFWQMLLDKGCYVVWVFQFLPIGKDPDLELMPTPEQRFALREKVEEIRGRLPIFIGDFWNDGPYVGGCIASGRRYLHINNRGDIEPCAFVHFSVDNIKEKPLKEALKSPFFRYLRERQPFSDGNLLAPCMIIDSPQVLREAVKRFAAYPTHEGADVILDGEISQGLDLYSKRWRQLTDPIWKERNRCTRFSPEKSTDSLQ
jgi:MoaA/NifB/PqqE/SkfB family radical SAM enzyme